MALTITKKQPTKNLGGYKLRVVSITFDAAYVNATGYSITAAQCGLRKILAFSPMVLGAYLVSPAIVAGNLSAVLKVYVGAAGVNVEAATNEAGLNGLVGVFVVWGI